MSTDSKSTAGQTPVDNKAGTQSRIDRNVKPDEKLSKDSAYVVHEDVRIPEQNMKIDSTSNRTITDIVTEGKAIFKKVKAAGVNICDEPGKNALYSKLVREHRDFAKALPWPFKIMIHLDEFSPKVLKKFLTCNKQLFWKTEDAWLNAMAGYSVDLFREKCPHASETNVNAYRQTVYNSLKKDSDDFKERYEDVKKEVEDLEKQVRIDAQNKLKARLAASKKATPEIPK